jgi:hypothetical protein
MPIGYRVIDANGVVLAHVYGQPLLSWGSRPMPLSGTTYDPDTLAMLYRALDEAP